MLKHILKSLIMIPFMLIFIPGSFHAARKYWSFTDKELGIYKSYLDTWWRGFKDSMWDDEFF